MLTRSSPDARVVRGTELENHRRATTPPRGRTRQSLENHAIREQRRHESTYPRRSLPRRGLDSYRPVCRGCRPPRRPALPRRARRPNRKACLIPPAHPPGRHPIAEHLFRKTRGFDYLPTEIIGTCPPKMYIAHIHQTARIMPQRQALLADVKGPVRARSSAVPQTILFSLSCVATELRSGPGTCSRRDPLNDCPNTL